MAFTLVIMIHGVSGVLLQHELYFLNKTCYLIQIGIAFKEQNVLLYCDFFRYFYFSTYQTPLNPIRHYKRRPRTLKGCMWMHNFKLSGFTQRLPTLILFFPGSIVFFASFSGQKEERNWAMHQAIEIFWTFPTFRWPDYRARMNNTSFFQAIQYQYNTRAPVLQYNTNIIPMQY